VGELREAAAALASSRKRVQVLSRALVVSLVVFSVLLASMLGVTFAAVQLAEDSR
jgi:cytochrome c oxidase assembly protein Cox11